MLSLLLFAAQAAAQPAPSESPVLTIELIERPAEIAPAEFIDRLIEDAGASGWQRSEHRGTRDGFAFRIIGVRNGDDATAFFIPAAEPADQPGKVCRMARSRAAMPSEQEAAVALIGCLVRIGMPSPDVVVQPLPTPRR